MRLGLLAALLATAAAPALAQPAATQIGPRVDKLEKEMRAVQRKVFPGGAGAIVEPEIQPAVPVAAPAGDPAVGRVTELASRVDALEKELARLTGQVEQNGFRVRQVEDQMKALRAEFDARLKAMEAAPAPSAEPVEAPVAIVPQKGKAPAKPIAAKPEPVDEDVKPSGDPAEDAYMAGYKLWTDKKYPQAEAALKAFVAKYPKHKRASYAQNLLGRAYLDEGKPATAAEAFVANYQTNPRGERAPDSLYFLGQSLQQLKRPEKACQAYGELQNVYGATLSATLKARVEKARADAKCDAG